MFSRLFYDVITQMSGICDKQVPKTSGSSQVEIAGKIQNLISKKARNQVNFYKFLSKTLIQTS